MLKPFNEERGEGFIERGLNRLGRAWWSSKMVPFNFAMHAEHKTAWDLDHISAGNEASTTCIHQKFLFDKLCKWFTVEGLPGSGKANFTSGIAEGANLKDMGSACLNWEHRRLIEFKNEPGLHHTWKNLIENGHHYLAMRSVDLQKFYENPDDKIHACRLQDHMKLQRHIHSMDALFHLLTTAQGTITNRTYHSDYCWAYAMMKMGYLSKNYYEMRYTVSMAAIDGANTASDLSPNVSFYLDISPEEAFEKIQARGNEAEINTINLEFLRHLEEAYKGFWAEDMNNKGCTIINIDPNAKTAEDVVDLLDELDEEQLRHPYSRWAHIHERQFANNNQSAYYGKNHALADWETIWTEPRINRSEVPGMKLLFTGGNFYEQVLQCNLARGPAFSYDLNHTFQPWDDLSESCSYKDNLKFMSQLDQAELMDDVGKHAHEVMRNELKPLLYHPDWCPPDADWLGHGHTTPYSKIMLGSLTKYVGNDYIQKRDGKYL